MREGAWQASRSEADASKRGDRGRKMREGAWQASRSEADASKRGSGPRG